MNSVLNEETLNLTLGALRGFRQDKLSDDLLLDLDDRDEFPETIVRELGGSGLGLQLLFIPEAYDGMGGGAYDVYRVCESIAGIDLGLATAVLATFLGSDPIVFGGTTEQKTHWLSRIANEGLLFAYGATEPQAGSDLGSLKTTAVRVEEDGQLTGYRINGNKQWISNGGYADVYTILARTPAGPSWFVVERDAPGLSHGPPEDKHGIRSSNTATVTLDDVFVAPAGLVGGVEGKGLMQAQAVFGFTRLVVAAFGLGAGWAALDRAIPYSRERVQGGGPLSDKQGYTHKLIVPHAVRLEVSRAYIEQTAERLDAGDTGLNTEGAIAKYLATEAGNAAADAGIQALGGNGYAREYMVEKIRRDVRITTIYEGTSEILEMTIARDRWQKHLQTRGDYYHERARALEAAHRAHPHVGADTAALASRALAGILERARVGRLTRNQHILFRLGELIAHVEGAASMVGRAANAYDGTANRKSGMRLDGPALCAASRIFAREAASRAAGDGTRWLAGAVPDAGSDLSELEAAIDAKAIYRAQAGLLADMNVVADALYERDR